jgi:hypothetical protein
MQPTTPFEQQSATAGPTRRHTTRNVVLLVALLLIALGAVGVGSVALRQSPSSSANRATSGSSALPAPTPSPSSPLAAPVSPPASDASGQANWVVAPESCGALSFGADGNAGPVTCPDGRPNLAAERYYRPLGLAVLNLGAIASPQDVESAICADLTTKPTTNPIEESAYQLALAEQNWHFGADPSSVILAGCPR